MLQFDQLLGTYHAQVSQRSKAVYGVDRGHTVKYRDVYFQMAWQFQPAAPINRSKFGREEDVFTETLIMAC